MLTRNSFCAGSPNHVIYALFGVEVTDIEGHIRYRQAQSPQGNVWQPIAYNVWDASQDTSTENYEIVNVTTTPYTVLPTSEYTIYLVDCTTGNITMNFPSAVSNEAQYSVKKTDSSANTITIDPFGSQTIDGSSTKVIRFQNTSLDIFSNNANLFIK